MYTLVFKYLFTVSAKYSPLANLCYKEKNKQTNKRYFTVSHINLLIVLEKAILGRAFARFYRYDA